MSADVSKVVTAVTGEAPSAADTAVADALGHIYPTPPTGYVSRIDLALAAADVDGSLAAEPATEPETPPADPELAPGHGESIRPPHTYGSENTD